MLKFQLSNEKGLKTSKTLKITSLGRSMRHEEKGKTFISICLETKTKE